MVKDIWAGSSSASPANLSDVNGTLFFAANNGVNGTELWKSDGTAAGTVMVKDIWAGSSSSSPANLINVNGIAFFTAENGTNGVELWKSDGTMAGTQMVKDIRPGSFTFIAPNNLTNVNGTVYFVADDGVHGDELWKSDGTAAGTVMVADIWPGDSGSTPTNLTYVDGNLFFVTNNGLHGNELWALDLAPPLTTINAPTNNEKIKGSSYPVTGTAIDTLSGVALVEVSGDGGITWNSAVDTSGNGTWSTWSYAWTLPTDGSYEISARATDKAGNVEVPGARITVSVDNADYALDLTVAGTGAGTVVSTPNGIASKTNFSARFSDGTPVSLHATPSVYSLFSGWSGDCAGMADCLLTMTADRGATATFTKDTAHSTYIPNGGGIYSPAIQAAYNAAASGDSILLWGTDFTEDVVCAIDKQVTISGGYNEAYTIQDGTTALHGSLSISSGVVTIEMLEIMQ